MTLELWMVTAALILALVQIGAAAAARTAELGLKWNAGPRDQPAPPPGKLAGRLIRAQTNLFETLPLFIGAVLIAHFAGKTGDLTAVGSQLYLWGRVAHLPLYALGVPYVRSLAWLVATGGLVCVIAAVFV